MALLLQSSAHTPFERQLYTELKKELCSQVASLGFERIDSILNYVCTNGDMERRTLGQDPYREFNWQLAFGDKRARVANYVDHLHHLIEGVQPFTKLSEEDGLPMAAEE